MVRAMTNANPFGDLDTKNLADDPDLEHKADDLGDDADDLGDEPDVEPDPAPVAEEVEVRMIHHSSHKDLQLIPGVTYPLPAARAATLVGARRAEYV